MGTQTSRPGDDYLKKLFAGAVPQPVSDPGLAATLITCPAIAAASIPDVLSKINFGFLIPHLLQGETNRMFGEDTAEHFFYDYQCPDLQSTERPDIEAELDEEEIAALGKIDLSESLDLELGVEGVSAGLNIVFNENTGLYQVDWAYVQTSGNGPVDLSCGTGNAAAVVDFLVAFSTLTLKTMNRQVLNDSDKEPLRKFAQQPPGQAKGPEPV